MRHLTLPHYRSNASIFSTRRRWSPIALAVAAAFAAVPGSAQITTSGAVNTWPGSFAIGPGNTDIGNNGLFVGNGALGTLDVGGGSTLRVGALSVGPSGSGNGNGTVMVSGLGTRLELVGDGFSDGVLNRLGVGDWGLGRLTVAGGAVLDGTVNGSACLGVNHYCNNFIGNAAGSDGLFTVTGADSRASFLRGFFVGAVGVFHPPIDSFTFGTPAGTTRGRVEVLNGGRLDTERVTLGLGPSTASATGRERSFAEVLISGAGSVWNVKGGSLESSEASWYVSTHPNSWASIRIENGGKLAFEAPANQQNGMRLAQNGGRADMVVTGTGSMVDFNGAHLNVGRALGTATLDVLAGGRLDNVYHINVGRDAATATMTIDGAGSLVTVNKAGNVGTSEAGRSPSVWIGRLGTGTLNVRNGGRLDLVNIAAASPNTPSLLLGVDGGSGVLNIDGSGSVVSLTSNSVVPSGGSSEARNPLVGIGYEAAGTLNVTNGGKLLLQGNAVSTPSVQRSTVFHVGGVNDTTAGGNGIAFIDGAGSEVRLAGSDPFIGIGRGPGSTGQLTISNQGLLAGGTSMVVGRSDGVGVLKMDNGRIELSGQQTGGNLSGANLNVGNGGGFGSANLTNGSRITVTNMGSAGASVGVGGSGNFPFGDGTLTLRGASRIEVVAGAGQANVTIGRDGSGLARLREGSSIDAGSGNLYVGRFPGSDGTLILTDSSAVTASYVGIGRNKTGNGGTGTVVVSSGSTLDADTIEIGPNGFLGGNGTIVGAVTNYGIVAPGSSPGTLVIDGSFINAAGGRIFLEVESNGAGGFNTDQLIFTQGSNIDLTGVEFRFQFLGATDPNAFQSSGLFDIDTFVKQQTPAGSAPLDENEFAGTTFSAQSDAFVFQSFAFSPASGATFVAAPVPEPSQWALMIAGAFVIARVLARRRSSR